jgi:hypothetical protein
MCRSKDFESSERAEYDQLKRLIYHEVCHLILAALKKCSYNGEAVKFGNGIICIGYPEVLIESMNFEELAAWLAICNLRLLHPCLKCLVHKDNLHWLTRIFTDRISKSMSRALAQAPKNLKADCNEHLKQYGLHDFEVCAVFTPSFGCTNMFISIFSGSLPTLTHIKWLPMTVSIFWQWDLGMTSVGCYQGIPRE